MQVIIQCAKAKQAEAKTLMSKAGIRADFVARPNAVAAAAGHHFCRPDDWIPQETGTWRQALLSQQLGDSTLLPAWQLYKHGIYSKLVSHFGEKNIYVLSAGWGLVRSDFKLPTYDITFSKQAQAYKKRRGSDHYLDFKQLPNDRSQIVFFGVQDYLPLLSKLLSNSSPLTVVTRNKGIALPNAKWNQVAYKTTALTNWHYSAASALLKGELLT